LGASLPSFRASNKQAIRVPRSLHQENNAESGTVLSFSMAEASAQFN